MNSNQTFHRDYPTAADLQPADQDGTATCPTHGDQLIIGADAERIGLACGDDIPNTEDEDGLDTEGVETLLADLLAGEEPDTDDVRDVQTFANAGVLTMNNGLVLRMADGSEFQVTIVRSR